MIGKVLFLGDAVASTGFARATHHIADWLYRVGWDVRVIGINYNGEPHGWPYPIHPACLEGDAFGLGRIIPMCQDHKPSVLLIQNDPWNIADCLEEIDRHNAECDRRGYPGQRVDVPVVAYMPVDGLNVRHAHYLGQRLALAIWYTTFAAAEAELCGFEGLSTVIELGVDLGKYYPEDPVVSRRPLEAAIGTDQFIVGNVNRNQVRKRMDLTIRYFAEWVHGAGLVDKARLLLHAAPTGDNGFDLKQLAHYYNVKIILTNEKPKIGVGVTEAMLRRVYAMCDVMLTTTQGEGFGLTTLEAMACQRPCIVPDWSALGDWTEDAAVRVPCTTTAATPNDVNVIGGVADPRATVAALDSLYRDPELRAEMGRRGLRLAEQPQFRWENVGRQFDAALRGVLQEANERGARGTGKELEATC